MAKPNYVLFLDDEPNVLKSIQRIFIAEPYAVLTAADHKEALRLIKEEPIKVVVSDYRMPDISGIEFLKQVRDVHPNIIRILFTGYANFATAEEAVNIDEVYRFISKPWNTVDLKTAITQAIEKYDLRQENVKLVDDLKYQRDALKFANKTLKLMYDVQQEFSSTISHELRTPLASIKMAIDIVTAEAAENLDGNQRKFLNKAKNNVDRLHRLINDILDLSKIESGKMEMRKEPNDINVLIEDSVDLHQSVAESKGLSFDVKYEKNLPEAVFDKDRITQVVHNLIGNAIKFTDEGGVGVATMFKKDAKCVEVCIADTGPGISKEDQSKLFKKFQQLGHAGERKAGGTGLGLAICKQIITRHGGKIWIDSEKEKGSRFYFTIPVKEAPAKNTQG